MADFARAGGAGNGIPYDFLASPCLRHKYTETIKLSLVRALVLHTENTTDCLQVINNQELPSRGDARVAPEEKLRTFNGWTYGYGPPSRHSTYAKVGHMFRVFSEVSSHKRNSLL